MPVLKAITENERDICVSCGTFIVHIVFHIIKVLRLCQKEEFHQSRYIDIV